MALRMSFMSIISSLYCFSFFSRSLSAATFLDAARVLTIIKLACGLNSFLKSGSRKKGITEPIRNWCQNFVCHKLYATKNKLSQSSSSKNDYKTVRKWRVLGLPAVHSLVKYE